MNRQLNCIVVPFSRWKTGTWEQTISKKVIFYSHQLQNIVKITRNADHDGQNNARVQ